MTDRKLSNKKLAFIVALIYVIVATIYSVWAMNNLVSDGILYHFFYPATIFPSLIVFTEREPLFRVLICQVITLLFIWLLFCFLTYLFRDVNKQENTKEIK
jgi:hypothetical protein